MEDHRIDEFYDDHHGFRVFIKWKSILEHLDPKFKLSTLDLSLFWFLKPYYSIVLDLENPKDRCIHPGFGNGAIQGS